jgi:hypothetical protein
VPRDQLALALFNRLEAEFPALIHPFGFDEWDPDLAGDVIHAITEVVEPWSRDLWLRGCYGFNLSREPRP